MFNSAAISETDKQRLKVLFKIWGDETTEADETTIGGISKAFLKDIGLGDFAGIGKVDGNKPEDDKNPEKAPKTAPPDSEMPPKAPQMTKKEMS